MHNKHASHPAGVSSSPCCTSFGYKEILTASLILGRLLKLSCCLVVVVVVVVVVAAIAACWRRKVHGGHAKWTQ